MRHRSLRDQMRQRRRAPARRRLPAASAVLAVALACLLLPAGAAAHAILTHSTPHSEATVNSSPSFVQVDFNEPVQSAPGAIRLFDSDGESIAVGAPRVPGGEAESVAADVESELGEGIYTVTYRVTSADGHPVSGGFSFGVGVPVATEGRTAPTVAVAELLDESESGAALEVTYGVARGLGYAALLLLVGALFFRSLVWRSDGGDARWPERTLFIAALVGLVSATAGLLLQGGLVAGVGLGDLLDSDVLHNSLETAAGKAWAWRVGLWLGLLVLLIKDGVPSGGRTAALGLLTAGSVLTYPLGGHASTQSPEAVLIGTDLVHVVAAGAWLGALVLLLVAYWPRRESPGGADGIAATARFSALALPAIVALAAAGLLQAWFYLDGNPAELVTSGYGLLITAKIVLLTAIVAIAFFNRRRIAALAGGTTASTSLLRRAMRAEVAIAVLVLIATAALVRSAPPASAGGPVSRELDLGPIRAELIIEPATTGPNDYHLYFFDRETGEQVRRVKEAAIRLEQTEEGIGPVTLDIPYKSPAHYELLGPALSVTGEWDAAVDVRVSKFDSFTARTEFEVRSP